MWLDDYAEGLIPDLKRYFGIDVLDTVAGREGSTPPSIVLLYVRGLPDTSLTQALLQGGREHYGWGLDRYLLADLYDATNTVSRVAGRWGKKGPPDIPAYPRPAIAKPQKKPRSLRDMWLSLSRG